MSQPDFEEDYAAASQSDNDSDNDLYNAPDQTLRTNGLEVANASPDPALETPWKIQKHPTALSSKVPTAALLRQERKGRRPTSNSSPLRKAVIYGTFKDHLAASRGNDTDPTIRLD
ncbi:hypothetical protein VE00_03592 [Pseudogymnoascus sp. WSF 3629]|nr:hypothetical protein VE00_03592 [Pseudogymnoascus sp. WSF 3629]